MNRCLEYGCRTVLKHVFPRADIPAVRLGNDASRAVSGHYGPGRRPVPSCEAGELIAGSAGVVHNPELYSSAVRAPPPDLAMRAEQQPADLLEAAAQEALLDCMQPGDAVLRGVPAPEHQLPLLYVPGASSGGARMLARVIEGGSIALLALRID